MAANKKPAGKAAVKIEKAKAQQWTRNRGKMPVDGETWVIGRRRDGQETIAMRAGELRWKIHGADTCGGDRDIMAWRRVRKPRQPKAMPPEAIPEKPAADLATWPREATHAAAVRGERKRILADTLEETDANVRAASDGRLGVVAADIATWPREHTIAAADRHADGDLPRSMTGLSPAAYHGEPADDAVADQLDPTSPNCPITTGWREEEIMRDLTAGRWIGFVLIVVIVLAAAAIFLRHQMGA
jgi:hypothetical protein